jgi:hypothetical protein
MNTDNTDRETSDPFVGAISIHQQRDFSFSNAAHVRMLVNSWNQFHTSFILTG